MKLRLRHNSIRLRLTQTEVESIAQNRAVEETIVFGPLPRQSVTYALETSSTASAIHAGVDAYRIAVVIPKRAAGIWASTDQVGLEAEQTIDGGATSMMLI